MAINQNYLKLASVLDSAERVTLCMAIQNRIDLCRNALEVDPLSNYWRLELTEAEGLYNKYFGG